MAVDFARGGGRQGEGHIMSGWEAIAAAFVGGVLTSASPCVLAAAPVAVGYVGGQARTPARAWWLSAAFVAGLTLVLVLLGLLAARLGSLMGALPGPWSLAVGAAIVGAGIWLWRAVPAGGLPLPIRWQQRLQGAGSWGAFALGALVSTVMSPCATPALAAALAVAGTGAAFGESMWWGAALLLAYGVGHGALLLVAGALPASTQTLLARAGRFERWLPGRRFFALLLIAAGLWWVIQGIDALRLG
jgi:cytochrome c biogenesis protein CcdA